MWRAERELGSGFAWMKRDFPAALVRAVITQPRINMFIFLFLQRDYLLPKTYYN
jgi:hypothetical protein